MLYLCLDRPGWLGLACALAMIVVLGAVEPASAAAKPPASQPTASQPASSQPAATQPTSSTTQEGLSWAKTRKLTDLQDSNTGSLLAQMLASVMVILVIGGIAVVVVKRLLPRIGVRGGKRISVRETIYLGPKKTVHLLQVGRRQLLVGSTKEQITMLADVTEAFEDELAKAIRTQNGGEE
jgi:flagellar biogenesis protein FliO